MRHRYKTAKQHILANKTLKVSDGVPVHIAASLAAGTVGTYTAPFNVDFCTRARQSRHPFGGRQ